MPFLKKKILFIVNHHELHVFPLNASWYSFSWDLVVECLDDRDDSIHRWALDLIAGMVTKKNLAEITWKLMSHMDDSETQRQSAVKNHPNLLPEQLPVHEW